VTDFTRSNPLLQAALGYAADGYHVFPLLPWTNRPDGRLVPRGFKNATTDPAQINWWWDSSPYANVGVALAVDGLVVADTDGSEGASRWGYWWGGIDDSDTMLSFPSGRTPSGGRHHFGRVGDGKLVSRKVGWLPNVDIPNYVPVWPSAKPVWQSGMKLRFDSTTWRDLDHGMWLPSLWHSGLIRVAEYSMRLPMMNAIPFWPPELLDDIRVRPTTSTRTGGSSSNRNDLEALDADARVNGLRAGHRNDDMHRLACRWWRQFWDQPRMVWALMYQVWNLTPHDDFPFFEAQSCVNQAQKFVGACKVMEFDTARGLALLP
jgi:hypothetical protein